MSSRWNQVCAIPFVTLATCVVMNVAVAQGGPRPAPPDSLARAVVGPAGGSVRIAQLGEGTIAAGAFRRAETLTVWITRAPTDTVATGDFEYQGPGARPLFGFDVTVRASAAPTAPYTLMLRLPAEYLRTLPPPCRPRFFKEESEGGPEELHTAYELVPEQRFNGEHLVAQVRGQRGEGTAQLLATFIVACYTA